MFAGCNVKLLPALDLKPEMKFRMNCGRLQYHTDGFFGYLSETRSLRNCRRELVCIAVTMADIYWNDSWNFVYSRTWPSKGLSVLSFARLDPAFPASPKQLLRKSFADEHRIIILRRCVKIILQGLGCLFGLRNCIYYNCLMNGSNHADELDQQALYLCPICLRKLHTTLAFDVRRMYETFENLCNKHGLHEDCAWYRKRLGYMRDEDERLQV